MKHKLIVFDWNGTLLADTIPSWKATNECIKFFGHPPISLKQLRATFDFPILLFYTKNGISVDEMLKHHGESNEIFQSAYKRHVAKARLRQGARDLLEHCTAMDYHCIILSNGRTEDIKGHLTRLKIVHYFDDVSGHNCDGTTILHKTTKIERLETYMTANGYAPENTTIIGDSLEEPAIARHLNLTSICITDGVISKARLKKATPNHIINNLNEIKKLL